MKVEPRMYEGYTRNAIEGFKQFPGELRVRSENWLIRTRAKRIFSTGQALKYWAQGHQPKSSWVEHTKDAPKTIAFTATETGFSLEYGQPIAAGERRSVLLDFNDDGTLARAVATGDSSIARLPEVNLLENAPILRKDLKDILGVLSAETVAQLSNFRPLQAAA